jgi:hypothetical protein
LRNRFVRDGNLGLQPLFLHAMPNIHFDNRRLDVLKLQIITFVEGKKSGTLTDNIHFTLS